MGNIEIKGWCRIRHLQPLVSCRIMRCQNIVKVKFDSPVRAITPGQTVAIYVANGFICLGGGSVWKPGLSYHERGLTLGLLTSSHKEDRTALSRVEEWAMGK